MPDVQLRPPGATVDAWPGQVRTLLVDELPNGYAAARTHEWRLARAGRSTTYATLAATAGPTTLTSSLVVPPLTGEWNVTLYETTGDLDEARYTLALDVARQAGEEVTDLTIPVEIDTGSIVIEATLNLGGGGGQVDEIVAGPGITVDDTDPTAPIVAAEVTQAELDANAAAWAAAISAAVDALKNGAPASGDTLNELHARLAVIEALGSLATDAELIAAVASILGSADTDGDTLGELQALIGLRLLKSANLSDLPNVATARTNLSVYSIAAVDAIISGLSSTYGDIAHAALPMSHEVLRSPSPATLDVTSSVPAAGPRLPLHVSRDGRVFGGAGSALVELADDGATIETVIESFAASIIACRSLEDGEMLVSIFRQPAAGTPRGSLLYKSTGFQADPAAATWAEVLESSETTTDILSRCLDVHGNVVLVGEYGTSPKADARRVWLSRDYGDTFDEVFDLQTETTGDPANAHVHGVCFDPWEQRLWVASGDGDNAAIRYSNDWGATWTVIAEEQPTTLIATRAGILLGGDDMTGAIRRVRRVTADQEMTVELVHETSEGVVGTENHWRGRPGDPVLMGFGPLDGGTHGYVIATVDGETFHEVYQHPTAAASLRRMVGPTDSGTLLGYADESGTAKLLTADEVAWVPDGAVSAEDLDTAVDAEATTRGNADTALDGRLDTLEAISIATDAELAAAISAHEADTTSVHGFANAATVETKVGYLTVTQAVDLDAIEARTPVLTVVARAGSWYRMMGGRGTAAFAANGQALYAPIYLPECSVDGLAIRTTVAAAANGVIRLGIYASLSTGLPGALVYDAGTVDATVAAGVIEKTFTAVPLTAGRYWLVAASQGAPATRATVRVFSGVGPIIPDPTSANILDGDSLPGFVSTGVTGALADPAPAVSPTSSPALVAVRFA